MNAKRIARELTLPVVVIGVIVGWQTHQPWWLIVLAVPLGVIGNYWFWRACGLIVFRLTRHDDRAA